MIPSAPTTEQCALMNFAYRLGAQVKKNDPSFVDGTVVRQEAKLLMSLSSSSSSMADVSNPNGVLAVEDHSVPPPSSNASGRITPQSITSASSGGSRRESFCFTCPSLSLEDKHRETASKTATTVEEHGSAALNKNKEATSTTTTHGNGEGKVQATSAVDKKEQDVTKVNGNNDCPAV
ncbi:MAG: hypothetical protein SGARI_002284, partial [Bacillariaceae sp.]